MCVHVAPAYIGYKLFSLPILVTILDSLSLLCVACIFTAECLDLEVSFLSYPNMCTYYYVLCTNHYILCTVASQRV